MAMTPERILDALKEEQVRAAVLATQIDGMRKLFDGAAMAQNAEQCDQYRQKIHALTDDALDCSSRVGRLAMDYIRASGFEI